MQGAGYRKMPMIGNKGFSNTGNYKVKNNNGMNIQNQNYESSPRNNMYNSNLCQDLDINLECEEVITG